MSRIRPMRLSRRENALVASAQAATLLHAANKLEDAAAAGVGNISPPAWVLRWAGRHFDNLANDIMRRSRFRRKGAR
jgi:hypothetical protein